MKNLFLFILSTIFLGTLSFSQESSKQIYEIKSLKDSLSKHKIVAILPYKVSISYKRLPKGYSHEGNLADEQNQSVNMQQGLYTYLLRKADSYTVKFQDVERTNALFRKENVFTRIDEILSDSLCKLLNVDAVIKCSYAYEKTGSEAGAIVKTLFFGVGGKTASGALTMQIYNSSTGDLLWRFYKEMNEGAFSNANEVMERMMRKVSRNFPYEK